MNQNKKINKYLPSKKFIVITLGVLIVLLIVFFVSQWVKNKKAAEIANNARKSVLSENTTLKDLVLKDTDDDGLADWEEALWGLDPKNKYTNDEVSDWDWVSERRKELQLLPAEGALAKGELTETEKFAREFFATVTALKQSGNLDKSTITNISNTLGQKMTEVNLKDLYSLADVSLETDASYANQAKYYRAVKNYFLLYRKQKLGQELEIISKSINDTGTALELGKIGQAYQGFAEDIKKLSVPSNLSLTHLRIINSAYNTGVAVINLAKISSDPVVGLIGLSQYQKYSEEFIKSSEDLRDYLLDNDIIKE